MRSEKVSIFVPAENKIDITIGSEIDFGRGITFKVVSVDVVDNGRFLNCNAYDMEVFRDE